MESINFLVSLSRLTLVLGIEKRENGVHRKLRSRHLAMIALGGTIGTGLFVGSGGALAKGGPVGALLGYVSSLDRYSFISSHLSLVYYGRGGLHRNDRAGRDGNPISGLWRVHALCIAMYAYLLRRPSTLLTFSSY